MAEYAIYLRKSRSDIEQEASGGGDTLARHRKTLLELAAARNLTVTHIYEEVVSGETLAARPEMQKLLSAVDQGAFTGVLVMEVERLARGDTIDQGIVAQSFKYSNTLIITPIKTYDPNNEFDEEYFEFGLFMSRREYKTINRRLQRGRVASINEGKWPGHKSPYGYSRVKLDHEKGFKLEVIPEQAQWVERIFEWFTSPTEYPAGRVQRLGCTLIAKRLNSLGVPSPSGKVWTDPVIREILRNPVYIGMVRWGWRAEKKTVVDGSVKRSRPRSADYIIRPGLHDPIVSNELYDAAQARLSNPSRPGPKQYDIKNPLAGIVVCSKCGHSMYRRPYQSGRQETLICSYPSCPGNVSSDLVDVEAAVYDGLKYWLEDFRLKHNEDIPADTSTIDDSISALEKELQQLSAQEEKAYDLVEQGIYSTEVFLSRTRTISARRDKILDQMQALKNEKSRLLNLHAARSIIIPNVQHVLDVYWDCDPKEKNDLLKSALDRVEYTKNHGARSKQGSDMSIKLFPKLPK